MGFPAKVKIFFKCDTCDFTIQDADAFSMHLDLFHQNKIAEREPEKKWSDLAISAIKISRSVTESIEEDTKCDIVKKEDPAPKMSQMSPDVVIDKDTFLCAENALSLEKSATFDPLNVSDPIKCDICEKTMLNKIRLKSHVTRVHAERGSGRRRKRVPTIKGDKEQRYRCVICDQRFDNERQLSFHRKTSDDCKRHRWRARFPCPLDNCKSRFKAAKDLSLHKMTVHFNQEYFQCHICNEKFATKGTRGTHLSNVHKQK